MLISESECGLVFPYPYASKLSYKFIIVDNVYLQSRHDSVDDAERLQTHRVVSYQAWSALPPSWSEYLRMVYQAWSPSRHYTLV